MSRPRFSAILAQAKRSKAGGATHPFKPVTEKWDVWKVRWRGYGQADDSWEPMECLAGCEDMIGAFRVKAQKEAAAADAEAEAAATAIPPPHVEEDLEEEIVVLDDSASHRRDHKAKWPNLYRMWRQFHGAPATSAGAKRLFSKAGKQHDDLKKNTKEGWS